MLSKGKILASAGVAFSWGPPRGALIVQMLHIREETVDERRRKVEVTIAV